ncbi:multicopper oxidase family protein [Hydrogenivirga sp. 128-5-R1-1]|uniref:multicopper oxidase family protein n=1 Tax=Hydrogenivirga sp. 128-5-R1-1 TaxID=392423 RepID=UPI00015F2DC7|nr:multicopper oxidase family protein [Hydrogenivirga sp. 128-5-R1-1]EDP74619.1 branched-chain amino acid aminotransferase [Hydrogenivirga sp. 128-5-R1-1]
MREVNRRQFLAYMGIGAAVGLVQSCGGGQGPIGMMMGGGGGGGTTTPGDPFQDPPLAQLTRNGNIVETSLSPMRAQATINGQSVTMMLYNGSYPAPTIRVRSGDILRVNFTNDLPANADITGTNVIGYDMSVTNLHTHGWHVSPSGNADNIFLHFNPGDSLTFEYDLSKQWGGMMGFYHPHNHGTVGEQFWRGLAGGALIVEDDTSELQNYEEHIMIITDISVSNGLPTEWTRMDYMRILGDTVMVNGQVNPVLNIQPGQVQRWRILNACVYRYLRVSLQNHTMYLVGTDDNLLDSPVQVNEILITPGERVDILVKADQTPGTYTFEDLNSNTPLVTVEYSGAQTNDSIPTTITSDIANWVAQLRQMDTSNLRQVTMTLNFVRGQGAINRQVFGQNTYILESPVGTYEVWTIVNQTGMDHPFHQHVDGAVILNINGGDPAYAQLYSTINGLKDTINVPPMGSVTMLVPVLDYTGDTVFHCHILGHEDIGMMGIWRRV